MTAATPYDADFYSLQSGGSYKSANVVIPIVNELIGPRSVCDVGCGVGTWLRAWQNVGVEDMFGIDGEYVDRSQLMIDSSRFKAHDLRLTLPFDRTFDLAMSLEVAEHLPSSRAESFVAELTAVAPLVLFSAAIPQQGGTDHVNEQWQDYWADLYMRRGFSAFDCIRPLIWNDDRVERWYRQNVIVFCHNDRIADYPALSSPRSLPLSLVHPLQYVGRPQEYSVRESATLLAASLRRAIERRARHFSRPGKNERPKRAG